MIKTMAVEINEATYPIAVACLPAGFAMLKKNEVFGSYLVINHLLADYMLEGGTNAWITRVAPVVDENDPDSESFGRRGVRRFNASYAFSRTPNRLVLRNLWMSKQDFENEFKRTVGAPPKKSDVFFVVVPL